MKKTIPRRKHLVFTFATSEECPMLPLAAITVWVDWALHEIRVYGSLDGAGVYWSLSNVSIVGMTSVAASFASVSRCLHKFV